MAPISEEEKKKLYDLLGQMDADQLKEAMCFVENLTVKAAIQRKTGEPVMYSLTELEGILHVSHRTLQEWVGTGYLPATKIGSRWKVSMEQFTAFMDKRNKETGDQVNKKPRYLTLTEAAHLLGFPYATLKGWADDGKLPTVRIGNRLRIEADEFIDFVYQEEGRSTGQSIEYKLS